MLPKKWELLPDQENVALEFMTEKDVFVSLPTGTGKSLCYSILPLAVRDQDSKSIVCISGKPTHCLDEGPSQKEM